MSLADLAGVILAAGESSRMGRDKALLPWPKVSAGAPSTGSGLALARPAGTILSASIQALSQFCDMVIVVAGKNEPALRSIVYGEGASLIRNPAPERGQFSSLQVGLREALNRGRDNVLITLVDRPPPQSNTLADLTSAFLDREHEVWAVVPEHAGKHGHPVLFGREMMEAFLKAPATANARDIEHANQARIRYFAVDDPAVTMNVDTPQEYESLKIE